MHVGLHVDAHPLGKKLYRLTISYNGHFIGEYERTQEADIARKKKEIDHALPLLLEMYRQKGEFIVRWDGKRRVKSIRVEGAEVAQIPSMCWGKPSWES